MLEMNLRKFIIPKHSSNNFRLRRFVHPPKSIESGVFGLDGIKMGQLSDDQAEIGIETVSLLCRIDLVFFLDC
jgi:hypothetical protein